MKRIQLEIKALSPLAIGRQKPGGSVSEVENYIPGTVIRGAIASQILQQYRQDEQTQQAERLRQDFSHNGGDFQTLFLGETPAIFQNAYPAVLNIDDEFVIQDEIRVLPATALSSKTKSGFKPENNGVFDTLIDRFCAERYGHLYDPNCPTDGGRVDTVDFSFYSELNDEYYNHTVSKRLLTRVGINRRRATAEEQILYSIEVLNESESKGKNPKPVIYMGAILVTDALADSLKEFINNHKEGFRLGGSTSRGLGKVKMDAKLPVDAKPKLADKINQFNDTLQKRWNDWKVFGNPLEEQMSNCPADRLCQRTYFTLDLQSDAILSEQWRRTTVISAAMLQQFTDVQDTSLKLEAVYSSYDYRSGWNAAWGLMKDVELVTNKGAVYLFSTTQKNDWIEALEKLEVQGIGERIPEGFGQVRVCDKFHLIIREEAV
ncbi:CRISPR-associated RAMP protein Csx10 [Coleofasciculus sp. H7-2]|uniref:type III-D CRISPR-associated RAMP protein Csx10 n=1 Tax=Coleofasciculus sp. H7-2 TaxID=3351545 RepID=UPI00366EB4F7